MKTTDSVEYQVCAKNKKGSIFVPNAFQTDIRAALTIYNGYKNGLEAKSTGAKVWIEKRFIKTKVMDFTATAEKMLEGVIEI